MNRHARTLALPDFDPTRLARLRAAHVLLVGVGGLGSAVLPLLAAQEVGKIDIVDDDRVAETNLPRQLLYTEKELGCEKALLAAERAREWNPRGEAHPYPIRLDAAWLESHPTDYDLILDCTDNFATRILLDSFCAQHHIPLVWGAVEGYVGQVTLLHGRKGLSLQDLFGELPKDKPLSAGVYPPLVQTIGSFMASEALRWLATGETPLDGVLLQYDAREYRLDRYTFS